MRILLTGTSGQVGGALLHVLRLQHDVLAPLRPDFDLAQPAMLAAALDRMNPDLVINPAAYTAVDLAEDDPEAAFRINEEAPSAIALWAARHDVPLIHFSTDYVFDGSGERPWREDDCCAPLSIYGRSKRAGEQRIISAGGRHLIVRTSWVYDARGRNFFRTVIRLATERPELRVVADQVGAPTSAKSIADAVDRIISTGIDAMPSAFTAAEGVVHLTNGGTTSWHGFASAILTELQARHIATKARDVTAIESKDFPTKAARPLNSRLDLGRLNTVFGISPPDWRKALDREMDDFVSHAGCDTRPL